MPVSGTERRRKAVAVMVNEARLLEEFKRLAAFDSESFHEKQIAEYLYKKLESLGLTVSMDDAGRRLSENADASGNLYAILKGNADGEPILFSSHMDTVAPGVGKKVIVQEDGKVTSDGSTVLGSDDLTGIAAILEMLTVIQEDHLPHPDIEIVFFAAEELYCRGSSVFDFSRIKAKKAYTLDLDGPIGRVANCAPSIIQFEVTIQGKSAHAGFEPEKGISAIAVASEAIAGLTLGRVEEDSTVNVGVIHGGTGKNIVPGTVTVEGEVRSLKHEKAVSLIAEIRERFEQTAAAYGAKVVFTGTEMVRAYHVDENAEVIRRYAEALKQLGYGEVQIITSFGGSDNNNFCKYGMEGIVLTNAMNKVHTTEEYFYLDEFVKSANILVKLSCG